MSKVENSDSQPDHTLQAAQLHQVQAISVADMKANMLLTMSSVGLTLSLLQLLNNRGCSESRFNKVLIH